MVDTVKARRTTPIPCIALLHSIDCVLCLLILVSCGTHRLKDEVEGTSILRTIVGNDGAEMMLIPAGEFLMGSKCYTEYIRRWGATYRMYPLDYTEPVHTVYLDAFYMDKHEVTNAQFRKFLQANPQWRKDGSIGRRYQHSDHLKLWDGMDYPRGKANYPVVYVSWYAAAAYAQWAGKRLPTEAEWEKAARGGLVGKKYPWGDEITYDNANYVGIGYYDRNYIGKGKRGKRGKYDHWDRTAPVGHFPPNGYGLYDMAGNVWEWCADKFDSVYYSNSPNSKPKGPGAVITFTNEGFMNVTSSRVLRGGSWDNAPFSLRCAIRCSARPQFADFSTGFRCCTSVREGAILEESHQQQESCQEALDKSDEILAPDPGDAEACRLGAGSEAIPISETIVGNDGAEMVLIPAGEFLMGSDSFSGVGLGNEKYTKPIHTVYVDAFYMDKYAVTNAQFRKFLQANPRWRKDGRFDRMYNQFVGPSHYLMHWDGMDYPEGTADHPIYFVSWYAASAYAQWAGKRLPTEAEWEKAARGGLVGKKYPWGNDRNRDYANYAGTGGRDKWDNVAPVGRFLPNGYGLYDMAGNTFEWCADEFDSVYYSNTPKHNPGGSAPREPDAVTVSRDRSFLSVRSARVVRGGGNCWGGFGYASRLAFRLGTPPGSSHYSFSFRCVQNP